MIKGSMNIKYGEILAIISQIYKEEETGDLICQNGPTIKHLYFQNGQVIFAASNAIEDKFTQILLEEGKIKEEQLEMAMQKKGNKTIAKSLTELGFISSSDLIDSLIKQVYRIAKSLIYWEQGSAVFKADALPQGLAKLPLSTPRLILDMALSLENRHWVIQVLGGIDKVVEMHKAEKEVALNLPLTDDEIKVVNLTDGVKTIENISNISGIDIFTTAKILLGFYYLKLASPKKFIGTVKEEVQVLDVPSSQRVDKQLDLSFLDVALPSIEGEEIKKEEEKQSEEVIEKEKKEEYEKVENKEEVKEEKVDFSSISEEKEVLKPLTIDEEEQKKESQDIKSFLEGEKKESVSTFTPPLFTLENEERLNNEVPKVEPSRSLPIPKRKKKVLNRALFLIGVVILIGIISFSIVKFVEFKEEKNVPPPSLPLKNQKEMASKSDKDRQLKEETKEEQIPKMEERKEVVQPKVEEPVKVEEMKKVEEIKKVEEVQKVEEVKRKEDLKETRKREEKKEETIPETPKSEDGHILLSQGMYDEAAKAFKKEFLQKSGGYTIALMIACERDTITKALNESGNSKMLIIFPFTFKGRNCFRVLWGYYRSKEEAEKDYYNIPETFRNAGAKVVSFSTVRP